MKEPYRCPRDRHWADLATCAGRKERKYYGCATCTFPTRWQKDKQRTEKILVHPFADSTKKFTPMVEIAGLATGKIIITPRVAAALIQKLQVALAR